MEKWSWGWRQQKLNAIHSLWTDCAQCPLYATRANVVFGEGNPAARILFCGEAPGQEEDREGSPFIGPAGKFFDTLLYHAGIRRQDVYITNVVACRPPENRDPTAAERNTCVSRVHEIAYVVDPTVIVPVGRVALQALCRKSWSIQDVHGSVFSTPNVRYKITGDKNGVDVPGRAFPLKFKEDEVRYTQSLEYDMIPILHPSFILREDNLDPETKKFPKNGLTHQTLNDLRKITKMVRQINAAYQS